MLGYRLEPQSKFTMSDRNTLSSSQRAPWVMAYCQYHSTIHVPWILGYMPEPPSIHVQWGQVYSHEPITVCLQLKLEVWASHNRCTTSASSRFWVTTQEIHNGCWVAGILFPWYTHHELPGTCLKAPCTMSTVLQSWMDLKQYWLIVSGSHITLTISSR